MTWLRHLGDLLAWPDGSGLVWETLLGSAAYAHTHIRLGRHHRERMAALAGKEESR